MTATAHALVGGAIAASVANPAIGLPLAAFSHPLLDMIPHWDFGVGWQKKTKTRMILQCIFDLSIGIVLAYLFFGRNTDLTYFFGAILLSVSWDISMMPYIILKKKLQPFYLFYKFGSETNKNVRLPWGILTQVGTVAAILLFLHIAQSLYQP